MSMPELLGHCAQAAVQNSAAKEEPSAGVQGVARAEVAFVLVGDAAVPAACAAAVEKAVAPVLGFAPLLATARMDAALASAAAGEDLYGVLAQCAERGVRRAFVLPLHFDFSLLQKQQLVESVHRARRDLAELEIYYDDPDPCHPLLLHILVDVFCRTLATARAMPQEIGLLLVASGHGDAPARAQSYRLMRLLWEQLGVAAGEVAFLRHEKTPLPEQLAYCATKPLRWVVLPQMLFAAEYRQYAELIVADFQRQFSAAADWPLCPTLDEHPGVTDWLEQRALTLWKEHRQRQVARKPSLRYGQAARPAQVCGPQGTIAIERLGDRVPEDMCYDGGVIAEVDRAESLAPLLAAMGLDDGGPIFVKVTWHGYATGTYTDAVALDALLAALPGKAVVLEGHSVSRNRGAAEWDWEQEAQEHRDWLRAEEAEYLERTGLRAVLNRHGATYLNVTEAYWDGQCAATAEVEALVDATGAKLKHRELCAFVPQLLLQYRQRPFISFARFKGPTRLGISNCFGLLPGPLRAAWHGPSIAHFSRVCCDMAQIYGALLRPYGLVEGLNQAVRWNRQGLYRSRWGHYDLIDRPGLIALSPGLVAADILASRLQGQDVERSAFFDVVRSVFGAHENACRAGIDSGLVARLS